MKISEELNVFFDFFVLKHIKFKVGSWLPTFKEDCSPIVIPRNFKLANKKCFYRSKKLL